MSPRALALALALAALGPGCVTIVRSSKGAPLDPAAVERLTPGESTLGDVLALFGAPLEVHRHTDGRLLVYRHALRNTFRLGIQPSRALSLIDLSQVASEAAGNLSLTLERIHGDQDRLVVLLDHESVVQAVGFRRGTDDVPVF